MMMDVQHIVSLLAPLKQQGMSPLQAVNALLSQASAGDGSVALVVPHEAIIASSEAVARALTQVFVPLSPAELAMILHESYPALSALDIGNVILAAEVFPDTPAAVMLSALTGAGFDANTAADAVNVLYPITVSVQSNQPWQATGLHVTGRQDTQISAQGSWTANPATGMVGPAGNRAFIAKPGYTLPGAPEGALVARIGDNAPFLVGTLGQAPVGQSGQMHLCINDDVNGIYGAGLKDNHGTLEVHIVTQPS